MSRLRISVSAWRRSAGLASLVIAGDAITKLAIPTEAPLEHRRTFAFALLATTTGLSLLVCSLVTNTRAGAGLIAPFAVVGAGVLGNGIDALDGTVANPFLYHLAGGAYLGFNLADVALVAGCAWLALASMLHVSRTSVRHAAERRPVST